MNSINFSSDLGKYWKLLALRMYFLYDVIKLIFINILKIRWDFHFTETDRLVLGQYVEIYTWKRVGRGNSPADDMWVGWPPFTLLEKTDVCWIACCSFFPLWEKENPYLLVPRVLVSFLYFLYVSPEQVLWNYPLWVVIRISVISQSMWPPEMLFGNALHSLMVLVSTSISKGNTF